MAIQADIVRILDAFTAPYSRAYSRVYSRAYSPQNNTTTIATNSSPSDDEVEWKTLDGEANFTNGKGMKKDITDDGKVYCRKFKIYINGWSVAKHSDKQICPFLLTIFLL